jgi:hypothetical protein
MNSVKKFIQWADKLDSDLDRDVNSYAQDDDGNIVYIDLQEAQVADYNLAQISDFTHLAHLNLCANDLTDEGLAHLAKLTNLQYLDISGNYITNTGMPHLKHLTKLTSLLMNGFDDDGQLTDAGLGQLAPLTQLTTLGLNSASITDESVPLLLTFSGLEYLDISFTRISDNGYQKLRKAFPKCEIGRDWAI